MPGVQHKITFELRINEEVLVVFYSVLVLLLPTFSYMPLSEAIAQKARKKNKKVGAMTEKVAKKLSAAQELIEEEKIEEGLKELNDIMSF